MHLIALNRLLGASVHASDTSLGVLEDIYIDPVCWQARYLAVVLPWRSGQPRLLVSVGCVAGVDGSACVHLQTSARHVSGGGGAWPAHAASGWIDGGRICHARTMIGAAIIARDGLAGRLEDLLFDAGPWSVDYLVASPQASGAQRLIPPDWVDEMDFEQRMLRVSCTCAELAGAPALAH